MASVAGLRFRRPGARVLEDDGGDVVRHSAAARPVETALEAGQLPCPEVDDGDPVPLGQPDRHPGAALARAVGGPADDHVARRGAPGLGPEDLVHVSHHELLHRFAEDVPGRVALSRQVAVRLAVDADAGGGAVGRAALEPGPGQPYLAGTLFFLRAGLERRVGAVGRSRAQRPAVAGHLPADALHRLEDRLRRLTRADPGVDAAWWSRRFRRRRVRGGPPGHVAQPRFGRLDRGPRPRHAHPGDDRRGLGLAGEGPRPVELVREPVVPLQAFHDPVSAVAERTTAPQPVVEGGPGLRRPLSALVPESRQRALPAPLPVAALRFVSGLGQVRVRSAVPVALRGLVDRLDRAPVRVPGGGQVHRAEVAAEAVGAAARYLEGVPRPAVLDGGVERRAGRGPEPGHRSFLVRSLITARRRRGHARRSSSTIALARAARAPVSGRGGRGRRSTSGSAS